MTEFAGTIPASDREQGKNQLVSTFEENPTVSVRLPDGSQDTYRVWFLSTEYSQFWFSAHYQIGLAGVLEIVETSFDLDKSMPNSGNSAPKSASVIRTYGPSGWMSVEGLKEPMVTDRPTRLMEAPDFEGTVTS